MREVHVVTSIDGCCGLLHGTFQTRNLVDGSIVADHHAVEAEVVAQDILKYEAVGHTSDGAVLHGMIAWHHGFAASQADHRFVGQQNLLHQLLLAGIATTAIAQIVFRTGTYAFLQITLLQALDKGRTHDGREIAVLAIRLLQSVERWRATHIDHWRQRQHATHLSHSGGRLLGLQLCQLGVERAGLANLLGIDGGAAGVDARQHLLVKQGRNAVRGLFDEPRLKLGHTVAQVLWLAWLLTGILREMADAVGNQFTTLGGV